MFLIQICLALRLQWLGRKLWQPFAQYPISNYWVFVSTLCIIYILLLFGMYTQTKVYWYTYNAMLYWKYDTIAGAVYRTYIYKTNTVTKAQHKEMMSHKKWAYLHLYDKHIFKRANAWWKTGAKATSTRKTYRILIWGCVSNSWDLPITCWIALKKPDLRLLVPFNLV